MADSSSSKGIRSSSRHRSDPDAGGISARRSDDVFLALSFGSSKVVSSSDHFYSVVGGFFLEAQPESASPPPPSEGTKYHLTIPFSS